MAGSEAGNPVSRDRSTNNSPSQASDTTTGNESPDRFRPAVVDAETINARLRVRERQQATVAELGRLALSGIQAKALCDEAVARVATTLQVEYAKILELSSDGRFLRLLSGVGWRPGLVGSVSVDTGLDSQAGYTLRCSSPVIVRDLHTDNRFRGPPLLVEHGIVSGMSVIIGSEDQPWGVLGTHSSRVHEFTRDDINFMTAVAHILTEAIRRQVADQEIRNRERRLTLVTDNLPVLMAYVDSDLVYRYCNSGYERWFGTRTKHVMGRPLVDTIGEEAMQILMPYVQRVLAGEAVTFERTLPFGRGDRHVRVQYIPDVTEDDRVIGFYAMIEDISERVKADYARARLAAIVEHSDDAIIGKDLDGIVTSWNAGAESLYGYAAEEIIGRSLSVIAPPDRAHEISAIITRVRRGEVVTHFETVRRRKDGTTIDVALTVSPIYVPDGELIGVSTIARDISERKKYEKRLQQADRQKDNFIAVLGHELRNPLGSILNATQVIESSEAPDESTARLLAIIQRQAEQMKRLLDDLLDVARISRGKITLRPESVNLGELIQTTAEDMRIAFDRQSVALSIDVPEQNVSGYIDPVRIAQCVSNLLGNALKFTNAGDSVSVSLALDGDTALIVVRDTGLGMEGAELASVFEPFRQFSTHGGGTNAGLGLGLPTVKRLVEYHGGSVTASSRGRGAGSEFTMRLPLRPSTALR